MSRSEVQVLFEVWAPLDEPEHGHRCSAKTGAASAIPVQELKELFPYEGEWHFRSRQLLQHASASFVWMDLSKADDRAPVYDGLCVIRAVPIVWPEVGTDDQQTMAEEQEATDYENEYLRKANGIMNGQFRPSANWTPPITTNEANTSQRKSHSSPRPHAWDQIRSGLATAQEQLTSAEEHVTKHMKQLWGAVKTTVNTLQRTTSVPLNDSAAENLGSVSDDLSMPPSQEVEEHMTLLESVWTVVFPELPFQRPSPQWKNMGFQKEDPLQELQRGGVLALRTMAYVMCTYPERMAAVVQQQKPKTKSNYPFAVVCINTTLMLADVLKLKDQRFLSSQAGYWQLFDDDRGFFELYSICLLYIDQLWISTNATRSEFGSIITQAKSLAQQLLASDPTSVAELRQTARYLNIQL